jgi:hypothetical protein
MTASAWNCLFGYPIYSDVNATRTPTLGGGSWSASLPLINLQDRRLAKVARSTDAAALSTKFDCDLKAALPVGIIALPGHTISTAGMVRVRGFTASPIFDSATFDGTWSQVGTPTRTPAALRAGGAVFDLIGDDDGASSEAFKKALLYSGNAQKILLVEVSKGPTPSANGAFIQVTDETAPADCLWAVVTWTGAVPNVGVATGSFLGAVALGGGAYRLLFLTTSITAIHTNTVRIGAAQTAAQTGNIYVGTVSSWDAATAQLVYDAGWVDVWKEVYPTGILPTWHPSYATRKLTAEDAVGYPMGFTLIPSTPQTAQFWRVEVNDTTNPAGVVDLGRLVLAMAYQPSINVAYGLKFGLETATVRTETDGAAAVFYVKPKRRTVTGALEDLPTDEALVFPFDLMRRAGTSSQLYFVTDPTDVEHLHRRSFLCTLRDLSPLEMAAFGRYGTPFNLVEEL